MLNPPALLVSILVSLFHSPGRLPANRVGDDVKDGAKFEVLKDIAYLDSVRPEKADLYLPQGRKPQVRSPAVLVIHGGGWTTGDKAEEREVKIATNLARAGYVVLSINYVLSTDGKVTWPQNVYDCKTAVRWLRKNADRHQIDPDHIGVIGGSAGGHLAAFLAVTKLVNNFDPAGPYGEFSCRVQCAVDLYGPIDLMTYKPNLPMFGMSRDAAPELYRAASPMTYVTKNLPPILILHGTADKSVALEQSKLFASALKKAEAPYVFETVEGAPHTFHLQPKQKDLRSLVIGFFDKHLKPKP